MRTHKLFVSDGLIQLGAVIIILRHGNVRQAAMSRRARSVKGEEKRSMQLHFVENIAPITSFLSQHSRRLMHSALPVTH